MATRNGTIDRNVSEKNTVFLITWLGLTFASLDDGAPWQMVDFADRSVHVTGTFGTGGSLIIEGSNDGVNWAPLSNPQGTGLTFTATGIKQVLEITRYLRPRITAGDGTTNLAVYLCGRKVIL